MSDLTDYGRSKTRCQASRASNITSIAAGKPTPISTATAWRLLIVAVVAQGTISFVELGVPVIAPFIKDGLDLSAAAIGLAVAAVNMGRILGSIPFGRVADRLGERLVILLGGIGVAVFAALAALGTYGLLVVGLVLCGAFAGSSSPAGAKLIAGAFDRGRRGFPLGIRQASIPLGALLATALLPALAAAAGWRWTLAAAALVPLAGAGVAVLLARGSWREPGSDARTSLRTVARDRDILLAGLWTLIFAGGQYAILTYLVIDLTGRGIALSAAVIMLGLATAGGIVGRLGLGWISDVAFSGRRLPGLLAVTATGAAVSLALAVSDHAPLSVIGALAVLSGVSLIGWQGLWVALVSELAPPDAAATALGFGLTFTNVGIVLWPPAFGLIADLSGGFEASWIVLAIALGLSLAVLLGIRERPSPLPPKPAPAQST